MATFYPRHPDPETPKSELEVWTALEQLPNSWRVFHSVGWQVPKRNRVFEGEADFVLLHRKHGFIVLEVKGGTVWVEDGTWFQQSRDGSTHELARSPFDQAKDAMYDLGTYLRNADPVAGSMPCSRAVVFPAASHPGSLGPDAPAQQILSRDELPGFTGAIADLCAYAKLEADIPPETISLVTQLLAPTNRLRVLMKTSIAEANRALIELTDQQMRVLDLLRRHDRALISGFAGTGKTILAIERARRMADEGHRTLLVCFNRPLADHMAVSLDRPEVVVGTFHQFALDYVKRAGFVANIEPTQEWWETELPDLLPQASERLEETFDAIVIDEGQDFRPEWFTALQLLLSDPDDGPMYVFYDENQTIYVDEWEPPFDTEPFELDTNCRNTLPIAEKVARVLGVEHLSLGAPGSKPVWVVAEGADDVDAKLAEVIGGLISKEGIDPGQITVLTDRKGTADRLRGQAIGGTKLHALGAKSGSIVETIHRFKGLESDVIVLIVSDIDDVRDRALAYIGMSRARALLVVIGSSEARREIWA